MNFKQILKSTVIGAALVSASITSAYAADCASASVSTIGILPSLKSATATEYIGNFTCHDATPAWTGAQQFVLSVDLGDSGYATLLTAASLKQTVYLRVVSTSWRSLATLIYLNDTPAP